MTARRDRASAPINSNTLRSRKRRARQAAAKADGDVIVTRPMALPRRLTIESLRQQGVELGDDCGDDQLFAAAEPIVWHALRFGLRVRYR